MKMPTHISFHGMEPSEAVEVAAREKAQKLEQFCPDIMSCRVAIELEHKHRQQGRPFTVRIDARIPGHELIVGRVENEDVHVALRDAFDDMKRQLEDAVRRVRGQQRQIGTEVRQEQFLPEVGDEGPQAKRVSVGKHHVP